MSVKKLTKENLFRYAVLYLALAFCFFSLVYFSILREKDKAFMSLVSILYVLIPGLAQKLFKFRIQTSLYPFIMFYTICPLLGFSYNFYYNLHWWDDILHAFAGVVFAMLGAYLPKVMSKNGEASLSLCVFSAFFFSVAIAGLWELGESFMDSYFGTDMQKDTLLVLPRPSYILSELLGFPKGELAEIQEIELIVNGQKVEYYVDLGLIDTMKDVFVETLGAGVYTILYRIGKGKYFAFEHVGSWTEEEESVPAPLPVKQSTKAEAVEEAAAVDATEKE